MNLLLEEEVYKEIDIDVETSQMLIRTYSRDLEGNIKTREYPWVSTEEDRIPRPILSS